MFFFIKTTTYLNLLILIHGLRQFIKTIQKIFIQKQSVDHTLAKVSNP